MLETPMTWSALTTCSPETTLLSASVLSEPHRQIGRAGEIEQRYSRGEGFAYLCHESNVLYEH